MNDVVERTERRLVVTNDTSTWQLAVWLRRGVSISSVGALWLLLLALLPVLLVLTVLVDSLMRRRLAATRAILFLLLFCTCEVAGIAIAALLWLRHLTSSRERFVAANLWLQRGWTRALWRGAERLFDMRLQIEGAEHASPGPVLGFFRHASVADTLLPMLLIALPHRVALRWVLKSELLWDPCMDIVGNRLTNVFVSRDPDSRADDVAAVGSLMRGLGEHDGVIIYPEGTRFSRAKQRRLIDKLGALASRYASVLPPRKSGPLALLAQNPGADVVFCAHAGFEPIATLADLFNGRVIGNTIHVRLWRVRYEDLPATPEERVAWLEQQWELVDRFVTKHQHPTA